MYHYSNTCVISMTISIITSKSLIIGYFVIYNKASSRVKVTESTQRDMIVSRYVDTGTLAREDNNLIGAVVVVIAW